MVDAQFARVCLGDVNRIDEFEELCDLNWRVLVAEMGMIIHTLTVSHVDIEAVVPAVDEVGSCGCGPLSYSSVLYDRPVGVEGNRADV